MNMIEVLTTLKRKIFEPKKKIIFDSCGNKMTQNSVFWYDDRKNVNEEDLKILEECDGWNVADKDYVDNKCAEILRKVNYEIVPNANTHIANKELTKKSFSKSFMYSTGSTGATNEFALEFFHLGLLLKPGCTISAFTLFFEAPIDEEFTFVVRNAIDKKESQIAKIKTNNNQYFTAESKYKVDKDSIVNLVLKSIKQMKPVTMALQILIEF